MFMFLFLFFLRFYNIYRVTKLNYHVELKAPSSADIFDISVLKHISI